MIEQQIDKILLAGDLETVLPGEEGEPLAEFQQQVADAGEQATSEVAFAPLDPASGNRIGRGP
jgi:hypothetical protein